MLHTLYAPASDDLRSVARHLPRQRADGVGVNTAQFFRPGGIFGLSIFFAQQIGEELVKTDAVVIEEIFIVQFLAVQRMRQRQL